MIENQRIISRRRIIQAGIGLAAGPFLSSCMDKHGTRKVGKAAPKSKINQESYWTRRQEWTGEEWVNSIVSIGDRTLMVRKNDGMGWTFPGGMLVPFLHGNRDENNKDIINAATVYVHDQALIPMIAGEAIVLAYGYVIDQPRSKMILTHWVNVFSLSDYLPRPQADLRNILDARWVASDDPEVGPCVEQRFEELKKAGEGKTLFIEPCLR